MSTNATEVNTILQTVVKNNYPNSSVDDYYNSSDMTIEAPAVNQDRIMQFITETLLTLRSPLQYGNGVPLTLGQKQELYQDGIDLMGAGSTALAAIITALTTAKAALS